MESFIGAVWLSGSRGPAGCANLSVWWHAIDSVTRLFAHRLQHHILNAIESIWFACKRRTRSLRFPSASLLLLLFNIWYFFSSVAAPSAIDVCCIDIIGIRYVCEHWNLSIFSRSHLVLFTVRSFLFDIFAAIAFDLACASPMLRQFDTAQTAERRAGTRFNKRHLIDLCALPDDDDDDDGKCFRINKYIIHWENCMFHARDVRIDW